MVENQQALERVVKQFQSAWEKEVQELETEIRPKQERLMLLRQKIAGASALLGDLNAHATKATASAQLGTAKSQSRPRVVALFTPAPDYWVPILASLVALGGRGRAEQVLNRVAERMMGTFTSGDLELLPGASQVRWQNRVRWQRKNMVMLGLLRASSPRGTWEITDKGRAWLKDQETSSD